MMHTKTLFFTPCMHAFTPVCVLYDRKLSTYPKIAHTYIIPVARSISSCVFAADDALVAVGVGVLAVALHAAVGGVGAAGGRGRVLPAAAAVVAAGEERIQRGGGGGTELQCHLHK